MSKSNWGADEEIWQTISPPMIPTDQDVELIQRSCPPGLVSDGGAPRILVLGVTPALIGAHWPAKSELHAVDYDPVMIDLLWKPKENAQCHCAYWQEMPFPDGHFDLVIGDCSFNALPGLGDYGAVLKEIARVKHPQAPLIARFFMQAEPRLSLAGLLKDSPSSFAGYSAAAKRLLVAIAASEANGSLNFSDIPGRIRGEWGPVEDYLAALGQSPAAIARAHKTYETDQLLNYPSRQQIVKEFEPYFTRIEYTYPTYDCGQFCPIVACSNP